MERMRDEVLEEKGLERMRDRFGGNEERGLETKWEGKQKEGGKEAERMRERGFGKKEKRATERKRKGGRRKEGRGAERAQNSRREGGGGFGRLTSASASVSEILNGQGKVRQKFG